MNSINKYSAPVMGLLVLALVTVASDARADVCNSIGSCVTWENQSVGSGIAIVGKDDSGDINSVAVYGENDGSGTGVRGSSIDGSGVLGITAACGQTVAGVRGGTQCTGGIAVLGIAGPGSTALVARNDSTIGTAAFLNGRVFVANANLNMYTAGKGIVLKSPNGTCYLFTVTDAGALTNGGGSVPCPS